MSSRENSANPSRRRSYDVDSFEPNVPESMHPSRYSSPHTAGIHLFVSDSDYAPSLFAPNGTVPLDDSHTPTSVPVENVVFGSGGVVSVAQEEPTQPDVREPVAALRCRSRVRVENVVFGSGGVVSVTGAAQEGQREATVREPAATLRSLTDRLQRLLHVAVVRGRGNSSRPTSYASPAIESGLPPPLSSTSSHQPSVDAYMTPRKYLLLPIPYELLVMR
jgi:hypothetical protein